MYNAKMNSASPNVVEHGTVVKNFSILFNSKVFCEMQWFYLQQPGEAGQ